MRWSLPIPRLQGLVSGCQERGLPWAVQCLACMAMAWIVAQGFWWLATPGSAAPAAKASPTLLEQGQRVVTRHFFGAANVLQPSGDTSESVPLGTIDARWRLIGTYVGSGAHSRAVLALEDGSDVVLAKVGDQLSTGHEVVEVRPDSVVLSKDALRGELVLRPTAQGEAGQMPPESRFGAMGQPPSADSDPFNKDSR